MPIAVSEKRKIVVVVISVHSWRALGAPFSMQVDGGGGLNERFRFLGGCKSAWRKVKSNWPCPGSNTTHDWLLDWLSERASEWHGAKQEINFRWEMPSALWLARENWTKNECQPGPSRKWFASNKNQQCNWWSRDATGSSQRDWYLPLPTSVF